MSMTSCPSLSREPPGERHRRLGRLGSGRPVGRQRGDVVVVRADPHAVAAGVDRDLGERADERLADALPSERLVDRELVQEHLGALVGMRGLDAAHETGDGLVDVGEQEVMAGLGEELRRPPAIGWCIEQHRGVEHELLVARSDADDPHRVTVRRRSATL